MAVALLAACGGVGRYVWVDDYVPAVHSTPADYRIQRGDLISIRVYNQDAMSVRGKVRSDGKLSMPFLNDVEVAGYTPDALTLQLQTRLKDVINAPVVTVSVEEQKLETVNVSVLGEIARPGVYVLEPGAGVLAGLAIAGGMTEFARRDRIFVLRPVPQAGTSVRIRFSFDALSRAVGKGVGFQFAPGDVLIVE